MLKLKTWKYRNTALLIISTALILLFSDHAIVRAVIQSISGLGYLGIILAGFCIVSTFTVVPATLLLAEITKTYGFWEVAILSSIGAIVGDFLIFKFIKDTVGNELRQIFSNVTRERHLKALFKSPFFIWLAPVIGAIIIVSPLPDEIGLTILGVGRMNNYRFLALAAVLDFIGIVILIGILKSI